MNGLFESRGGKGRCLVDALKDLQPRPVSDLFLHCGCRKDLCACEEDEEDEEVALPELRKQMKSGEVILMLLFMGGSD